MITNYGRGDCLGGSGLGHVQARRFSAVSLHAFLTLLPITARAQSALSGIVHDPTSRVAVGAVVIMDDNVGGRWEGVSNNIGYYEIHLPPGEYNVEAYLNLESGQQLSYVGGVLVLPNENTGFDITLGYATAERVTVTSVPMSVSAPPLPGDGALGDVFTREAIQRLPPTNGRTLQSFVSIVPGVVVTDSVGTLAQFTAAGQRRFSNRLTVDGLSGDLVVDVRGPAWGAAGFVVSSAKRSLRVPSSVASAISSSKTWASR